MTHFPEWRLQLHSLVATACHLKLTTCFIIQQLIMHSGSLMQGNALPPHADFYVKCFFYNQ
jgi:hypothetical protein